MKNEDVRKLNFDNWPLPDKYLVEIGRVSALWASLESLLNMCIGKLAGFNELNDPSVFILINHSSFPQRLDIMSTFCEQYCHQFENLKEYKGVISKLRSAQKLRNKYAHNGMSVNPDTKKAEMPIGSARGSLKVTVEPIDIADIRRAVIAIDEAQNALYKMVLKIDIGPVWKRKNA